MRDEAFSAWLAYLTTKTVENRNRVVCHYLPHTERIASSFNRRFGGGPDHTSEAYVALVKAVDAWSPREGRKFETFLFAGIRNAFSADFRRKQAAKHARVPTSYSLRRRWREAERDVGHKLSLEDAAAVLGVPEALLADAEIAGTDNQQGEAYWWNGVVDSPQDPADTVANSELLDTLLAKLTPAQQEAIELHYLHGLNDTDRSRRYGKRCPEGERALRERGLARLRMAAGTDTTNPTAGDVGNRVA